MKNIFFGKIYAPQYYIKFVFHQLQLHHQDEVKYLRKNKNVSKIATKANEDHYSSCYR